MDAARVVAREEVAQLRAARGDDGQIVLRGDLVEPRGVDLLDDDVSAARGQLVHPAIRLQAHVDSLKRAAKTSHQAHQPVVQRGAERQEHPLALRRDVVPEIQPQLALVREREIESRRRAGRTARVQPLLRRAIGVEIDPKSSAQETVRGGETADARTDDGDAFHELTVGR
jgi:hypothetical protein